MVLDQESITGERVGTSLALIIAKRRRRRAGDPPDYVDVHVGNQLRERRTLLGLSQTKIAKSLLISFQQVQKYERGRNRISAAKLFQIAGLLDTSITYFFEGLQTAAPSAPPPTTSRILLETSRQLGQLNDRDFLIARRLISELVKTMPAEGLRA